MMLRIQATRTLQAARRAFVVNAAGDALWMWGLTFVGLALFAYFQRQPAPEGLASDRFLPYFMAQVFPSGTVGLVNAAILAAALSSVDAAIHSSSSVLVVDVYNRLLLGREVDRGTQAADDPSQVRALRLASVLVGAAGTTLACNVAGIGSLIEIANKLINSFTGPLFGIFLLAMFSTRTPQRRRARRRRGRRDRQLLRRVPQRAELLVAVDVRLGGDARRGHARDAGHAARSARRGSRADVGGGDEEARAGGERLTEATGMQAIFRAVLSSEQEVVRLLRRNPRSVSNQNLRRLLRRGGSALAVYRGYESASGGGSAAYWSREEPARSWGGPGRGEPSRGDSSALRQRSATERWWRMGSRTTGGAHRSAGGVWRETRSRRSRRGDRAPPGGARTKRGRGAPPARCGSTSRLPAREAWLVTASPRRPVHRRRWHCWLNRRAAGDHRCSPRARR